MKGSLQLGKIAGIRVSIHWTFLLLIAYIAFSNYRNGENLTQTGWTLLLVGSVFFVVFLHELGHALAAKHYHINTTSITLLPIGGVANLESIPENPKEELVVAFAGPAVNIVIAAITGLFITFPDTSQQLVSLLEQGLNAQTFFIQFLIINIWLAVFNLIPAFPMDGGRVLRALLAFRMPRHKATLVAARIGQFLAILFVFAGFYSNPFLIFIGLFIILGAQSEAEMTKMSYFTKGHLVRDVVMHHYETLQETQTIAEAVELLLNGTSRQFLVLDKETPVGTINRDGIIQALSQSGKETPIGNIVQRNMPVLDAGTPLEKIYLSLLQRKDELHLVYDSGVFIGVLDFDNVAEFVMIKNADGNL